jgi:hypothetical protein
MIYAMLSCLRQGREDDAVLILSMFCPVVAVLLVYEQGENGQVYTTIQSLCADCPCGLTPFCSASIKVRTIWEVMNTFASTVAHRIVSASAPF